MHLIVFDFEWSKADFFFPFDFGDDEIVGVKWFGRMGCLDMVQGLDQINRVGIFCTGT